eukprot:EG_transcript_5258
MAPELHAPRWGFAIAQVILPMVAEGICSHHPQYCPAITNRMVLKICGCMQKKRSKAALSQDVLLDSSVQESSDAFLHSINMQLRGLALRCIQQSQRNASRTFATSFSLPRVGVSAMAVYVPKLRVRLQDWCQWTGNDWNKVQTVVGRSFRMPSPHENLYTMAANAVVKLIIQNDIDPREIGFLGLGTESSTDNAAGAVIVLGMVNMALDRLGMPRLPRSVEVPEFKHACLGGIYALKAAIRMVATDPRQRKAIVVCGDIAEYERGSTGEQTQGAGTCAMFISKDPSMFRVDMAHAGSSSAYRGPDFRKPFSRHFHESFAPNTARRCDFPVFSGPYSANAYLDATAHAVEDMCDQLETTAGKFYREEVRSIFFHRPFAMMPIQALSFMYVRGMARGHHHHEELKALCAEAKVDYTAVLAETEAKVDLFASLQKRGAIPDPFPNTKACARRLQKLKAFTDLLQEKMSLGSHYMAHMGNLYSAALPAWIAAAFDEAATKGVPIAGQSMVAVGYGSGDAAEALPIVPSDGWLKPASQIKFAASIANGINLTREQYESIHDGKYTGEPLAPPANEFCIVKVGERYEKEYQDLGVEYYDYALNDTCAVPKPRCYDV